MGLKIAESWILQRMISSGARGGGILWKAIIMKFDYCNRDKLRKTRHEEGDVLEGLALGSMRFFKDFIEGDSELAGKCIDESMLGKRLIKADRSLRPETSCSGEREALREKYSLQEFI